MQIKTAVKHCYFAVEPCIVYTTRQLLPAAKKGVLPAFHQSNIVYQFLCHCNSRYVGRTSQRLQQRIVLFCFIVLFAIFILHSRESELYRYTLDGKSALAWELPFLRFMGHLSST